MQGTATAAAGEEEVVVAMEVGVATGVEVEALEEGTGEEEEATAEEDGSSTPLRDRLSCISARRWYLHSRVSNRRPQRHLARLKEAVHCISRSKMIPTILMRFSIVDSIPYSNK